MKGNDFSNQEWLISTISDYLSKGGIEYTTENPDPENVNFQFKFEDHALKLSIVIGQAKDNLYRIDIVSVVNFSPEHVNALNKASPKDKLNLLDDVFFWLSPRDPDFLINLNPKVENQLPHYLVILPIFEGDLTLGNLMRSIRLVVKSSGIARRRIQIHLAKYIKSTPLEKGNNEDGK